MEISARIKRLREERMLTQGEFAEMLKLSKQAVSNYETGQRKPSLDMIINTADICKVSVDYILGRTEHKNLEAELERERVVNNLPEVVKETHHKLLNYQEYIDLLSIIDAFAIPKDITIPVAKNKILSAVFHCFDYFTENLIEDIRGEANGKS